jgi:diacylglycerol kinase (ATP)
MNGARSFYFIKNPAAGKYAIRARLDHLVSRLRAKGYHIDVDTSKYPGHARDLAGTRSVEPGEIFVSAGGDGTFNEIASAKVKTGAVIAILPFGSGNGLARSLKVRESNSALFQYLHEGEPVDIDAGIFGGNHFFCTSGIGFDALVAAEFNAGKTRGLTGYIYTVLRTFFNYKPVVSDL